MAQIVIEKSPITDFLDELPGLIMQYKQMQWAQEERALEREERKAATTQQILLKEYYDKKAEVRTTEKVFDQYDNLKPSDVSSSGGSAELLSIVDKQNNIDMDAITQNLDALGSYQSELESSLGELRGQAQTLKEMQMDFAGKNRVLEAHEYEAFQEHALQALDEGGLGWDTTAGADLEYYKTDPEARFARALNVTEKMKSDEDTGAKSNYAILQSMYTIGADEDAGDLVDRLTYKDAAGKEVEPSEDVIAAVQRLALQPNYDEFVANLNALPAEYGGDAIRNELMTNPNTSTIFGNLQGNVRAINTLDNELAGINELDSQTKLGQFVSDISGVSNQQALFGLFDQAVKGLEPEEHEQFFNAMELQTGIDLEKSYGEYKGFSGGAAVQTETPINSLDLLSDKKIQAEELGRKVDTLFGSGFTGTDVYEDLTDSLKVLNMEIRSEEKYLDYREKLDKKILEGKLSEEELSELSSLLNISIEDLELMIEDKRQKKIKSRVYTKTSAYERGLMK